MKTLYLDFSMGVAGDMFSAALLDLMSPEEQGKTIKHLNQMGLGGLELTAKREIKAGVEGLQLQVKINGQEELPDYPHKSHYLEGHKDHHEGHHMEAHKEHHESHHMESHKEHHESSHMESHITHHHGRSLSEVLGIVEGLSISPNAKKQVKSLYENIALAESKAHGKEVGEIHFHEVGMNDAIFDLTAAVLLMEKLHPDKVVASHLCVGKGKVKCAHGLLDVPAPATRFLLEEGAVPYYFSDEEMGELTTPTGAAISSSFVTEYVTPQELDDRINAMMKEKKTLKVGYGMGHKDFSKPNCVVAYLENVE